MMVHESENAAGFSERQGGGERGQELEEIEATEGQSIRQSMRQGESPEAETSGERHYFMACGSRSQPNEK